LEAYPDKRYRGAIFASETLGDYLAFTLPHDTMPVAADTHVHLFTPEHWRSVYWVKCGAVAGLKNMNLVVVEATSHPLLCDAIRRDGDWLVVLDGTGSPDKIDPRCRLFVALRRKPVLK
jgi:hypothetical protein